MISTTPLLSVRKLTRWFGSIAAVRDLDLTVGEGDVYGFLGLNGAGKTTTLRATLGLLKPTQGHIELLGKPVHRSRPENRAGLGALVEAPAFYGRLSGLRNLRALGSLSGHVSRDVALRLIDLVGLSAAATRPARTYSLGMKQRLGIALALVAEPRMVILDEPTNGLDPQGIRDVRDLLLRLNREEGLTILVSSHLLAEVEQLCSRVGIIHKGEMVLEGDIGDLVRTSGDRFRLIAEPLDGARRIVEESVDQVTIVHRGNQLLLADCPNLDTGALVRHLCQAEITVTEIARERLSLEEIFLREIPGGEDRP